MHQHQQDHDRLNVISQQVSGLLENLPADWHQVYSLAQEADSICKKHEITCPFDLELIRSVKEQAVA